MLVTIDPGVNHAGVALWNDVGELKCSQLIEGVRRFEALALLVKQHYSIERTLYNPYKSPVPELRVVVEVPQVYPGGRGKGDPNDLINLAFSAGRYVAACGTDNVTTVKPREWKGQIPKPKKGEEYIVKLRALKRLTPAEVRRIEVPKSKLRETDVFDAIGIGLYAVGRK